MLSLLGQMLVPLISCLLFLPIKRNRHQSEDTSCHGDVGYEVVDCAVDVSERPMTAGCQKAGKVKKNLKFFIIVAIIHSNRSLKYFTEVF